MKEERMKRAHRSAVFAGALLALATLLLAETVVVKVQTTSLRKDPKFYAAAIAALKAGDSLEKLSSQGGWVRVKTSSGVVGWVHSSAVETKKFNLMSVGGTMKTQASASEVALAGKGFNKQVEDSYKSKHANADFAAVDRMLKIAVSPAEVEAFIKKGKLAGSGGGK
jgi:SH3-like domain-containing protein